MWDLSLQYNVMYMYTMGRQSPSACSIKHRHFLHSALCVEVGGGGRGVRGHQPPPQYKFLQQCM